MILEQIAMKAHELGLPFLIIGGHAVNLHGYSRFTKDVDLLIKRDLLPQWSELLTKMSFALSNQGATFCQFRNADVNVPSVDLMLVNQQTFEKLSAKAGVETQGGISFPIVAVEHLIALKLHVLKQDLAHRRIKDFLDVVELVRLNGIDLQSTEMREIFERYGTEDLYRRIKLAVE